MKRWHEEYFRIYREWKKHHDQHVESNKNYGARDIGRDPYEIDCVCDKQIGRFRKKDNGDCGQPRCWMCHSDKFPKREKTRQERKADLRLREQRDEM